MKSKKPALISLAQFSAEQLKSEISLRKEVERARKYLPSAEATLARATEKVQRYRALIAQYGPGDSKDD